MALDPEELKRRRQQRQEARLQREKRRKQLFLRLGIAAGVLIACGILIFVVSRQLPEQPQPEQTIQAADSAAPDSTQATQQPLPPTTTIRLALAGDLNVKDKTVGSGTGYEDTFLDVAHVLADADLTVLNFEGVLCGAPYGTDTASAPQQMMEALDAAGVDLIQLANSYSIYNGISGLQSTINAVHAAGMEPVGAYADNAAYRAGKGYTLREIDGIQVAFVAFTKGMDGMALPAGSENCVNVLYTDYDSTYQTINTEGITKVLENVKKANADIIVALMHWGSEYNNTISASQEKIMGILQENGVDVVVGTHSHYVQKMVFDRAKGTFIAYSLGDFLSDGQRAGSEYSVIVELEITKDNTAGTTKVSGWNYTPIFSVNEGDAPTRVVRLNDAIAAYEKGGLGRVNDYTYSQMLNAVSRIEARIAGE